MATNGQITGPVTTLLLLLPLVLLPSPSSSQPTSQPNVIFILADDYGYHDIGYHGNSRIRTPNLDRLSSEGVRLENYYVQPICTPTRSNLMSGRYQIHTGLQHSIIWSPQPNALPRDSPTLADKMKEAGYATHAVGKWHLGFYKQEYMPTERGFDSFYGYLTGSEDYFRHTTCYKTGCYLDLRNNTEPVRTANGTYSAQLFTGRAIDIVKQHSAKSNGQPLFLYLAYQSVHGPMQVPDRYMDQYQDIKDKNRRTLAGMVSCMDEGIANLTLALQASGLWDNTVMVFSTDNGGQVLRGGNNWPLRGWKGSLWEGGMKGVGFVHSKKFLKGGVTSKAFMHVSDWYPTLVEGIAGHTLNGTKPLDGFNQWPTIKDGADSPRKELLHNIDILFGKHGTSMYPGLWDTRVRAAIRQGDMKLITGQPGNGSWIPPPEGHNSTLTFDYEYDDHAALGGHSSYDYTEYEDMAPIQNVWLFNITADPNEHNDLSKAHPDIVKQLLARLAHYNSTAVPPRYPKSDPNCDPAKHGGVWGPWQ